MIVSLEEWRRHRRAPDQSEAVAAAVDVASCLGDEVVRLACGDVLAGRTVEVHRLAAAIVVSGGDTFF